VTASAAEPSFTQEQIRFFEQDVKPILQEHCAKCHSGEKVKGNLRLTSRESVLKGGDLGPAVMLDSPASSNLMKAINYKDGLEMPPGGKLPDKQREILTKWVTQGLPWTPGAVAKGATAPVKHKGGVVTEEAKKYWAYQPIKRAEVPQVASKAWVSNPIDAFILTRLEAKGLKPAAPADPIALIRRVTFDLTGLPPTPAEVDSFVKDYASSPQSAYEALVDRLLASPHYGEKWGRNWLDVVHYAETNGYERDSAKPFVWRFRDYVIRSFNDDKPFDRFIKEQLAGDEIDRNDPDCIIATGYYRLGLFDDEPADREQARFDELDDWVATTGQVFLGMTLNCARCHEHKIDPLPHADYYRLLAFFQDVRHYSDARDVNSTSLTDVTPLNMRKTTDDELRKRKAQLEQLEKRIAELEDEAIKKMSAEDQRASEGERRPEIVRKAPGFLSAEQRSEYTKLRQELRSQRRQAPVAQELALSVNNCERRPPGTSIMIRGNPHSPGAAVKPGFPTVLGFPDPTIAEQSKDAKSSGRRIVLANWIASKDNQLTARVIVNRVWQNHFGRGIVPTPNDFGQFGERPTHPELLDWLASEFVDGGWHFKKFHKLILMSSAYRMASTPDPKGLSVDPANSLLWRFNMRRLTAEEVRDSLLAVSGKLNSKMNGPSVFPKIPKEVLAGQSVPGQGWSNSPPDEANRRSVYVHLKRSLQVPVLAQFDQADTDSSCPVRYTTTVPTQALGLLNGEFSNDQAGAFAERLQKESPGDLQAQVRLALRLTTSRTPTDSEVKKDVDFIRTQRDKFKLNEFDALKRYCLLAMNANEFVYLD
jgi:Protein of unknown function (DUF1553)/Protein of unknown function (DUF1549)/Planctomycete cytochrome C